MAVKLLAAFVLLFAIGGTSMAQDATRENWALAIHGGAGSVEGGSLSSEDDPLFNAGRGAVFTADGRNELDASPTAGPDRTIGSSSSVTLTTPGKTPTHAPAPALDIRVLA